MISFKSKLAVALVLAGSVLAARAYAAAEEASQDKAAPNTLTAAEKKAGWKLLFDGKTTNGWRNYRSKTIKPAWKAIDGQLVLTGAGGGDILTADKYGAFELSLEYKIGKAGNSGIMFAVTEEGGAPWHTGPEIQLQDNKDGTDPEKSGWLYQLYKPNTDATKPVGQWNQIRLVMTPKKSEVYMNGQKYYEFVQGSKDWDERVAQSKFAKMPGFGKATSGYICLQEHGHEIAFRNIKIRVIEDK
ncbi:MAG: 3-keto-disaccharide hydrolase [Pirellulales bacterium]